MSELAAAYAHCEAALREADHDLWLAALFAPAALRPRLHALGAFSAEVALVRERVRQPLAGEIRIQWWRDVVEGERAEEASAHPVAAALLDTAAAADLPREPFGDMLDAHRLMLYDEPPADLATLEARFAATRGLPIRLAGMALGGDAAKVADAATDAGVALGLADLLQGLGQGDRRTLLPVDLLARHRLGQNDVDAARASQGLVAVLDGLRAAAGARLATLRSHRGELGPAAPAFLTTALVEPRLRRRAKTRDPFAAATDVPLWRRQLRIWRAARSGGVL